MKYALALLVALVIGASVIAALIIMTPSTGKQSKTILLVPIIAIVILVYSVIIIYRVAIITNKLPDIALDISAVIIFSVIIGMAAIFVYSSVIVGSVPINYFGETFSGPNNMSIVIDKERTVSIPLQNAAPFPPRDTIINATVYHNMNTTIQAVKLSSIDSILSHPPNFRPVDKSNLTTNVQIENYTIQPEAQHNLQIKNASGLYRIDVLYSNNTVTAPQKWSVPFSLSTKTEDMSIFSYFWIVLIGVMASRLISLVLDKVEEKRERGTLPLGSTQKLIELGITDYVWIIFSFIIAVLIFSSFNTQVQLTTTVVANISLAFGFGFGFDKVLEVAKRFQNIS
jgi:hypothetical protein